MVTSSRLHYNALFAPYCPSFFLLFLSKFIFCKLFLSRNLHIETDVGSILHHLFNNLKHFEFKLMYVLEYLEIVTCFPFPSIPYPPLTNIITLPKAASNYHLDLFYPDEIFHLWPI